MKHIVRSDNLAGYLIKHGFKWHGIRWRFFGKKYKPTFIFDDSKELQAIISEYAKNHVKEIL